MILPQPGVMSQRKNLPSVTEILTAAHLGVELNIPPEKQEHVLLRGQALHSAIELDLAGDLDEDSVNAEILPRLTAFRKFAKAVNLAPIATEIELTHPTWRFMGHPDLVGYVDAPGARLPRLVMPDWKSSVSPHAARLQLSGYALLWEATYPEQPIDDYLVVHLKADGTYTVHTVDLGDGKQVFLASVVVWYARKEREKTSDG